ncbi:DUF4255 domain-containing protein [Serinicoccus sediminis]|uniref:DUF4255 domain-containing protein n=1 Tax=Serinicoccus sediminis TaxID=2306021 RepID=UPI0010217C32|nr:DUF4255 domain-containing protein [Serinicoccus sediminis]
MIQDVDAALRSLLLPGAEEHSAEVSFEAPTRDWGARRSGPTLDVYLFDIREDVDLRSVARELVRAPAAQEGDGPADMSVGHPTPTDGGQQVAGRKVPPRFFRLSYLVTAWTTRPEDEHRMLADALRTLVVLDALPAWSLTDGLAEQPYTVRLEVALPVAEDRTVSDLWTALGGELKPSLDLVVTAPVDAAPSTSVAPPARRRDLSTIPHR